ncbi:MAG: hypothetical protein U0231_19670 [Nitrospiraceae bacterium]
MTQEISARLDEQGMPGIEPTQSLASVLRRQDMSYVMLCSLFGGIGLDDSDVIEAIELEIKYEGYIKRQLQQIRKSERLEHLLIPVDFDYDQIQGFSGEVKEKLKRVKPDSLGQASRISGVTPAAISLLMVALEKRVRSH